ncbi:uncharacterized protein LOC143913465 [Arctopsyche grandis]|uniref:uncharacterized protein LOC143913465 n=1 Tax=Arctopsyche grandis TaxID=121162 RepID=UPI00406D6788
MKVFILYLVLALVAAAVSHERGCQYILGRCQYECPEGTHAYVSSCQSPTWSEKTCEEPTKRDMGAICDLSRCECDEPTVKNKATGKCVKLEDCPKQ